MLSLHSFVALTAQRDGWARPFNLFQQQVSVQHFIFPLLDVKFAALLHLRREILDLLLPVDLRLKLELFLKLFDLQLQLIFGCLWLLWNRIFNLNLLLYIDSAAVFWRLVLFGAFIYLLKKS